MAGQLADGVAAAATRTGEEFTLAEPRDDAGIRALLRRTPTPGRVRIAFTREPDYFAGEGLGGGVDYTVVHRTAGTVDALGRLSAHVQYRNGVPRRIGYLGELRLSDHLPRRAALLRDGYAMIGERAVAECLEGCFTSIAADNVRARQVLEHGGRLGLPTYTPIADLVTIAAPVPPRVRGTSLPAAATDASELSEFFNAQGERHQLALTWDADRWAALARHGLLVDAFRVVRDGRRIVAAGAVWDQRPWRQVFVHGYEGPLGVARPFVNALAPLRLTTRMPAPGDVLAQGSIVAATAEHEHHWRALASGLLDDASARGLSWLVIARDARDPELAVLRHLLRGHEYHTRLYDVRWSGAAGWTDPWNGALFRPEVALL